MMKKLFFVMVSLISVLLYLNTVCAKAHTLSITGMVRQPMNLTLEDLNGFDSIKVQLNELNSADEFSGVFYYRGVALRQLLELAGIEKEETAYGKLVDVAIRVSNRYGDQVALSWGEVFYKNPGRIIVATSAQPIMPRKDCGSCHSQNEYESRMNQLHRKIGFPKLVIPGDVYSDRSIEDIRSIEVLDLRPKMPAAKTKKLFSSEFTITGKHMRTLALKDLAGYPRVEMRIRHLGEGKGYHGINDFEGAPLRTLLENAGLPSDTSLVFMVSAPDGYRSLFSYGEVILDPLGDRMVIADKMDGCSIEKGGKFMLLPADDLMSDRDVKAVKNIEVFSIKKEAGIYVIGMGCGDTNLISLEAISHMAMADAYVCPPDIKKRFAKYMADKPVLLNIYEFGPPVLKRKNPGLSQDAYDRLMADKRERAVKMMQDKLDKGQTVAILDYGDPTIWSGWSWAMEYFGDETIEIIPGLSSFNVSNALLERKMGCNGSIILTTSRGIMENPSMLEPLSVKGETLCIFMGLKDLHTLVPEIKRHYSGKTTAYLAYKAGYAGSEHLIETTLDGLQDAADAYHEKFLGLIYVGPCLSPKKEEICH